MAIASSAAQSPTKKRKTAHLGKRVEEVKKMDADDQDLGNLGSVSGDVKQPQQIDSGDSKQPQQIDSGASISGDPVPGSKNGKTCHQCRQKTVQFAAECKNIKKNKQCVIKLCCKCLFNRYGEKVEEVALLDDWNCPKCRGICNCSFCMRKRGQKPTGMLVHTAKASGFSSVSEMFNVKGTEILNKLISQEKLPTSDEDCVVASPQKENLFDQKCDAVSEPMEIDDADKDEDPKEVEIILPHATELTNVAEVDLPAEDVGNALQFIEFCFTFREILDIKKGQAESILYDITAGRGRPGKTSSLVQFQIQLLTLIKDLGEKSPLSPIDGKSCWLHVLKECISESESVPQQLPALDFETTDGYYMMGSSEKLRLLVFLCDETLETIPLRNWIEEQNLKFFEEKKEARGKLLAAKEKEKLLKKQLHDEVVKAAMAKNDASLPISEHEAIVSELKAESERAQAEILETTALLPKYISTLDEDRVNEKWFTFDQEELKVINEQISLHRVKRQRRRKAPAPAPPSFTPAAVEAPTPDIVVNGNMNPAIDLNEIPDPSPWDADEREGIL